MYVIRMQQGIGQAVLLPDTKAATPQGAWNSLFNLFPKLSIKSQKELRRLGYTVKELKGEKNESNSTQLLSS